MTKVNTRVGCGVQVRNFLAVLIRHERLSALSEILQEYRSEMNRRLSISDAAVVTARPLKDQERAELERQVTKLAGMRVNATFREDKSLIGGAIVQHRKHDLRRLGKRPIRTLEGAPGVQLERISSAR